MSILFRPHSLHESKNHVVNVFAILIAQAAPSFLLFLLNRWIFHVASYCTMVLFSRSVPSMHINHFHSVGMHPPPIWLEHGCDVQTRNAYEVPDLLVRCIVVRVRCNHPRHVNARHISRGAQYVVGPHRCVILFRTTRTYKERYNYSIGLV